MYNINMMIGRTFLCTMVILLGVLSVHAQEFTDKMYLVLLDIKGPEDIAKCYTKDYDRQHVQITYEYEDKMNYLVDFIDEEEKLYGPDCFIPELKLVFEHYTYVVSLYCSSAIKYKNSSPFTPSSSRMKNDLIFTASVTDYLNELKVQYFGYISLDPQLIAKLSKEESLDDMFDLNDDFLLEDDDEDDDLEPEDKALFDGDDRPAIIPLDDDEDDDDGRRN